MITHSTMITGNPYNPVKALITCPIADSSATIYRNRVSNVSAPRYNAVTMPNLCLAHSVNTKPSGHFLRMIGTRAAKMSRGNDEEMAYTMTP